MIFHFQLAGPSGWIALGSGVGTDPDPVGEALEDLRAMAGGTLPCGDYRWIPAKGHDARFSYFEILDEGAIPNVQTPA